jgi:hypothetical protein
VLSEKPRAAGKPADRPTTQEYLQPTTRLVKPLGNIIQRIDHFFGHRTRYSTIGEIICYVPSLQIPKVVIRAGRNGGRANAGTVTAQRGRDVQAFPGVFGGGDRLRGPSRGGKIGKKERSFPAAL